MRTEPKHGTGVRLPEAMWLERAFTPGFSDSRAHAHRFWVEWKNWGTLDSINNLAGTLSFLCMCGLVLTARESFRRRSYEVGAPGLEEEAEMCVRGCVCSGAGAVQPAAMRTVSESCRLSSQEASQAGKWSRPSPHALSSASTKIAQWFYRFHIVFFLGFMVFASMHYSGSWRYFTPGEDGGVQEKRQAHSCTCLSVTPAWRGHACVLVPGAQGLPRSRGSGGYPARLVFF